MNTFNSLIGDTTKGAFRGIRLGCSLNELYEIEGNDGVSRDYRGIVYNRDISPQESFSVSYENEDEVVTGIHLKYTFDLKPEFKALGRTDTIWDFIFTEKKLSQLQAPVKALRDQFVDYFTKKMGEPEIDKSGSGLTKTITHQWVKEIEDEEELLEISYNFEYNNEFRVYKQILSIYLCIE